MKLENINSVSIVTIISYWHLYDKWMEGGA